MDRVGRWAVGLAMLGGLAPALGGCGEETARAFGFARNSPNEFTVTTQAPLVMPPDEALPPPVPGEARPQDQSPRVGALEALAPDTALGGTAGAMSPGQVALLADADRTAGARSSRGEITGGGGGLVGDLAFWSNRPSNIVVDGDAEQHRLREDQADGVSPDQGPTPASASP